MNHKQIIDRIKNAEKKYNHIYHEELIKQYKNDKNICADNGILNSGAYVSIIDNSFSKIINTYIDNLLYEIKELPDRLNIKYSKKDHGIMLDFLLNRVNGLVESYIRDFRNNDNDSNSTRSDESRIKNIRMNCSAKVKRELDNILLEQKIKKDPREVQVQKKALWISIIAIIIAVISLLPQLIGWFQQY